MKTPRTFLPLLTLALTLVAAPASAAIYKWVDEEGNTHYGSAIPPEYAKQDTTKERMNEKGQTVEIVQEKDKTPEQKAEEKRLRLAEEERKRAEQKQRQHDRLLLNTYDSVDGLEMARDGKIRSLEGQISVAQGQIKEREALLARQRERAAELERSGRPISKKLKADMTTTEEQIARNSAHVESLRADQERIRATYDADIDRYRELKGMAPGDAGTKN
jgi:hypothetical protein